MKKSTKLLLTVGAAVATPLIINHVVSKRAQARVEPRECEEVFNWEYGDIRYVTAGDVENPPMLMVHGIYPGAAALEYKEVMENFAKNYRVYAIDLLGFGYSDKPNVTYSTYLYVRLIKDFVEGIIGKPVAAVASLHSAAALATCAKLNPEWFTNLVLISPTGTTDFVEMPTDAETSAKKVFSSPIFGTSFYHALTSMRGLAGYFRVEGLREEPEGEDLDELYLSAHAVSTGGKYPIAALLAKHFNVDIKKTLDELETPHHIITGSIEPNPTSFGTWRGLGTNTATSLVDDARLLPHVDKPEEFYDLCKELLKI